MTCQTSIDSERAVLLPDLAATERLADEIVSLSNAGDLLLLTGPMGAGKTTLTQAVARRLGSAAVVTSPTYTLVHEYPTPHGPLVHIDAYRLGDAVEVERLGLEDYLGRARLTVVEWGAGLADLYPDALWIDLSLVAADDTTAPSDAAGDVRVLREARRRGGRDRLPFTSDTADGPRR